MKQRRENAASDCQRAITFDYRGWGESHGRLIAKSPQVPHLAGQAHLIRADQAMLIIVAEKEELFDNREHGQRVYERLGGPKQYTVRAAIENFATGRWFDEFGWEESL